MHKQERTEFNVSEFLLLERDSNMNYLYANLWALYMRKRIAVMISEKGESRPKTATQRAGLRAEYLIDSSLTTLRIHAVHFRRSYPHA